MKNQLLLKIIKSLLAGLVTVSVCIAQTINISGKVTDTGTTPIAGAIVKLENSGLTATSGADGSFTITGTIGIINSQFNKPMSGKINASVHNGYLNLNIREKSNIEITTYTIQGKALSFIRQTLDAGSHSIALPNISAGVCLYRIQAGKDEFVIKNNSLTSVSGGIELSSQNPSSTALTRQSKSYVPINDVIAVTKDGYLNYQVIVTNSDTSGIEIKMIVCAGTVTDADGNVYQAVKIGNQVWTVENLRTTKYNNGSAIPLVTDVAAWTAAWSVDSTGAYCYYENTTDTNSIKKYGALYNWYAVDTKKLAPKNWHVPTDAEWDILQNYLIANGYNWDGTTMSNKIAKSMAAKTDWYTHTIQGAIGCDLTKNNRTGFSALPGGVRGLDGLFDFVCSRGYWWSTTETGGSEVVVHVLDYHYDIILKGGSYKGYGFSVRLVRGIEFI